LIVLFLKTPGRRKLRFYSYEQVMAEIERLAPAHRTLGRWSLGQICEHLADTQEAALGLAGSEIKTSRLFRATVGRISWLVLLWFGFIPEQFGGLGPRPPAELDAALSRLRASFARISTEPQTAIHPVFGSLSQDQWRQFHLRHAAHHLSFVIPTDCRPDEK
jgi:hypothetical protein